MKNRVITSSVLVFLFLIACLFAINYCENKKKLKYSLNETEYSNLQKEATENIKADQDTINRLDSIKSVNAAILIKYNHLLKHPAKYFYHDTVRIDSIVYLASANHMQLEIDSTIIKHKDKQIKELFKKDSLSVLDINYIKFKFDSLSSAPKGKGKAFFKGVLVGYGLAEAKNLILKGR